MPILFYLEWANQALSLSQRDEAWMYIQVIVSFRPCRSDVEKLLEEVYDLDEELVNMLKECGLL